MDHAYDQVHAHNSRNVPYLETTVLVNIYEITYSPI